MGGCAPCRGRAAITAGFPSHPPAWSSHLISPPRELEKRIEARRGNELERGLQMDGGGAAGVAPHLGTLRGRAIVKMAITSGNWPHAGSASHSPRSRRHKRPVSHKRLADMALLPKASSPFRGPVWRLASRTLWIPGTAFLVAANPSGLQPRASWLHLLGALGSAMGADAESDAETLDRKVQLALISIAASENTSGMICAPCLWTATATLAGPLGGFPGSSPANRSPGIADLDGRRGGPFSPNVATSPRRAQTTARVN